MVSNKVYTPSVSDYVNLYKDLAVTEMKRTGIPASITLAQGIIESDCGRSSLAREANNHFGIKCHGDWKGPTIKHDDNNKNECFRKYSRPEESFYDHSSFLKSTSRYSFLFTLNSTDYKAWAHGLKRAGYATNPDYANMLIRTIEENNLWYYDRGNNAAAMTSQKNDSGKKSPAYHAADSTKKNIAGSAADSTKKNVVSSSADSTKKNVEKSTADSVKRNTSGYTADSSKKTVIIPIENTAVLARAPRVLENNRIQYIIVKDGETREKLENEFQLLRWELPKYNELRSDFQPAPGQILYLQPKRDKAEPGKEYYSTVSGDTMYLISQRYGIKLKRLYEMNRLSEGTEPATGQKIWLRSIKPVH